MMAPDLADLAGFHKPGFRLTAFEQAVTTTTSTKKSARSVISDARRPVGHFAKFHEHYVRANSNGQFC